MRDVNTILDFRLKRGWTQLHLANLAGLERRTIMRAEAGKPIHPLKQQKLADFMGVDRRELFPEEVA